MLRRTCGDLLACFLHLHARLRVLRAPGIPCSLFFRGTTTMHHLGTTCRGNADLRPLGYMKIESEFDVVIASEAKQSMLRRVDRWIASSLRFARNDERSPTPPTQRTWRTAPPAVALPSATCRSTRPSSALRPRRTHS